MAMMMVAATTGHHCDESVEAAGGVGGRRWWWGGWRFASLCVYLQLPDGAQQKQSVVVFPLSPPLPSLSPGFWTMFQAPYAACGRDEEVRGGVL